MQGESPTTHLRLCWTDIFDAPGWIRPASFRTRNTLGDSGKQNKTYKKAPERFLYLEGLSLISTAS